jgi:dihydroorotate dehydrogenase
MPDWFYHTVSRPALFRLPAATARDFALGFMGRLGRLPLGGALIDFLGHLRADERLRETRLGHEFPTAVGLGPGLDFHAVALQALARFGFGFIEVGPITMAPRSGQVQRRIQDEALLLTDPLANPGLQALAPRLRGAARSGVPLMARLGFPDPAAASADAERLMAELAPHVSLFSAHGLDLAKAHAWPDEQWSRFVRSLVEAADRFGKSVLLCTPADLDMDWAAPLVDSAREAGCAGFVVDGSIGAGSPGRLIGLPTRAAALERVRHLRARCGGETLIIAAGGVHEPAHALELREAGADLIEVDSGLVYSGPGLPKRINEALLFQKTRAGNGAAPKAPAGTTPRAAEMTWFWTLLLGAGMFVGSLLALAIAATQVVLPYDEAFVGMSRAELHQINPRLLAFMAHDRVSLAGTMIAVGVMYLGLSWFGIRAGLHWAKLTVFISAFTGFASFFLFLGFGYLDTFHAFVTTVLLQLLLLGVRSRLGTFTPTEAPPLYGDRGWRLGLWGQFLFVLHGFALLGAGVMISAIGVTTVFVHEDLDFMQTTAEALRAANPRLVPLVAHDRASFGGMLLASGWAFLLPALWGFRAGAAWLWWTYLCAGLPAYAAAIGVHYAVGYTHPWHLLPAFSGLGLFAMGLGFSYPFLCANVNDGLGNLETN